MKYTGIVWPHNAFDILYFPMSTQPVVVEACLRDTDEWVNVVPHPDDLFKEALGKEHRWVEVEGGDDES